MAKWEAIIYGEVYCSPRGYTVVLFYNYYTWLGIIIAFLVPCATKQL